MAAAMIGPKFFAWDRNGNPLAYGKLYTFQAKTNVPKPTYQSEEQIIENTNPVILNGEGYADVYLDGSYKMVLKDKDDNEIWTSDPVSNLAPAEWTNCESADYLSPTSFRLTGNKIAEYRQGRKLRVNNNATTYGFSKVEDAVFDGTNTDVTMSDGVALPSLIGVCTSVVSPDSSFSDKDLPDFTFQTVEDATSVPNSLGVELSPGDKVKTREYNAEINQEWKVSSTEITGEYSVPIGGTGYFLIEVSNEKYFESFGAYGNNTDLDDDAFEFAQSYPGKVEGKGNYLISNSYNLTNGTKWKGNWSKISAQGSNQLFLFTDCEFGDFELDGLNGAHTSRPTQIASPSENVKLGDLIYRNFAGVIANFQTYPLNIPMYGAKNFSVGNVIFYDITQEDDGVVTGAGFVGGIYLVGLDVDVSSGKSNGSIGDVYGFTIKSIDSGSGVVQDSDLVRSFLETSDFTPFDITFGKIYGRNVYKRIVKLSGCSGLTFGNVSSFNPDDGVESYTLHSVVECLNGSDHKFGNVRSEGPADRVVWLKGNGHQAGNIFDGSGCQAVILGDDLTAAISCQVGQVLGRGNEFGSAQGTGVRFYNANLCNVTDISGRFAVSASTDVENTGKSTINSITCAGRISLLNGSVQVGNLNTDITSEAVAGTHIVLGQNAKITTAEIITDGRVTFGVGGSNIDVDLGRTRIVRATSENGVESSHSVFTTTSAVNGILRGKLEIEVNASVSGTPSGSSGRTLAYFTGLNVDDLDLSMNVTAPTRGATGFNYWFNNVDGQANRIAVKSAMSLVGSQISGKIGISKLENLVPGGSTVTCSGEVNIGFTEKEAASVISGANYNPNVVNSTR